MIFVLEDGCAGSFLAVSRCMWALDSDALRGNQQGNPQRQNVIFVIRKWGKISWQMLLKNLFMSIIPLGNIEVMCNFSEVAIFVLSKLAPVWLFDLDLRSQKF